MRLAIFLLGLLAVPWQAAAEGFGSEPFAVRTLAAGLSDVVSLVFPDSESVLVAQRPTGKISRVNLSSGESVDLSGGPEAFLSRYVGLNYLTLHPQFENNGYIYVSYTEGDEYRTTTAVDRFQLNGNRLDSRQRIFTANQYSDSGGHYAGRMTFDGAYLFVSLGDRLRRERAQDRRDHVGTIVRLNDDGTVPESNPFIGDEEVEPEIWTYGHRNPQGLFYDVETNELWSTEHGPRGGDELNLIKPGLNYGWPEISYGFEYDGGPIGKGITAAEQMEQPRWVWVPSIAPSDLIRYRGKQFPQWQGDFFTGSLARTHLSRIKLVNGIVVAEERLLMGTHGRIRAVAEAPDGSIYLASDAGYLIQLYAPVQ